MEEVLSLAKRSSKKSEIDSAASTSPQIPNERGSAEKLKAKKKKKILGASGPFKAAGADS